LEQLAALGINLGFLVSQIINFIILMAVLSIVLYKPLLNMLEQRREKIRKGLEDARAAEERLANAEAEAQKLLDEKRAEAQQIVSEARGRADEAAAAIETEAREEAQRILRDAQENAEAERNRLLADMRGQIAELSLAAAQRIIGDGLDGKKQKALVDEFFGSLPPEAKGLGGQSVIVTTALPLTAAEQKKAQKEVGADDVEFVVDPSILGGAIVRAGDRVVDGSVRGQLGALQAHLQ
jgi:F-type H+-transporting ATPase subunit b